MVRLAFALMTARLGYRTIRTSRPLLYRSLPVGASADLCHIAHCPGNSGEMHEPWALPTVNEACEWKYKYDLYHHRYEAMSRQRSLTLWTRECRASLLAFADGWPLVGL